MRFPISGEINLVMKHAEHVTFGGSGLERVAEIRGDAEALAQATSDPASRAIVLWRGKPLAMGEGRETLVRLPMNHEMFAHDVSDPILLGRDENGWIFARDISLWEPAGQDVSTVGSFFDPSKQNFPGTPEDHVFCDLKGNMTRLSPRDAELAATAKAVQGWHMTHRFCAKCGAESERVMAGWQRNCPSCGGQHFPRTDPVVIMLILHGNKVLMGRSPGWPEGMYSLLAGFIEPGETIEAAVRREVFEESGVKVGHVDYLASQPWAFPSSLMIGCRGEALSHEINIDPHEIEDACWVTREEMMQSFAGENPKLMPARKGSIAHFLLLNWLEDKLD